MKKRYPNFDKNNLKEKIYKSIMPKVYGIGAAVVIVGAMFKLLNWPGASMMLGIGLTTEALIFFLSAFEPAEKELDWAKVYPELVGDKKIMNNYMKRTEHQDPVVMKLNTMLESKVDANLIDKLSSGMQQFSDAITRIPSLSSAATVTERYIRSVDTASDMFEEITHLKSNALTSLQRLTSETQNNANYCIQVQEMSENLRALNEVYKQELTMIQQRSGITHQLYANVSDSMNKMQEASLEAERFKSELAMLSEKIESLNVIYGKTLTAFKG